MRRCSEAGFTKLAEVNHKIAVKFGKTCRGPQSEGDDARVLQQRVRGDSAEARRPKWSRRLAKKGILGGVSASRLFPSYPELENLLLLAATETNSEEGIDRSRRCRGRSP